MAGLDVTEKAVITLDEIEKLSTGGKISKLVYELLLYYNKTGRQFGFIDSPLHDLCAVAYLIAPEIFYGEKYYVDIVTTDGTGRGLTFADKRKSNKEKHNAYVLLEVDRVKFVRILWDAGWHLRCCKRIL